MGGKGRDFFTLGAVPPPNMLTLGANRIVADRKLFTKAGDLDYQWLRDGEPIAGATGSSYTPVPANAEHRIVVLTAQVRRRMRPHGATRRIRPSSAAVPGGAL